MNTQQLKTFVQVAENLNFARAAESLNITQSAVSRQIHALEEELIPNCCTGPQGLSASPLPESAFLTMQSRS